MVALQHGQAGKASGAPVKACTSRLYQATLCETSLACGDIAGLACVHDRAVRHGTALYQPFVARHRPPTRRPVSSVATTGLACALQTSATQVGCKRRAVRASAWVTPPGVIVTPSWSSSLATLPAGRPQPLGRPRRQRDRARADLDADGAQRLRGLLRMTGLDTSSGPLAAADLDVVAADPGRRQWGMRSS